MESVINSDPPQLPLFGDPSELFARGDVTVSCLVGMSSCLMIRRALREVDRE